MAPCRQTTGDRVSLPGVSRARDGNKVVITGISGLFPSSETTTQFAENLFNKVDMVTENNLNFLHPEAPKYYGKIDGMTKFDTQFFKISYQQAVAMDPMNKKLLEQVYMAMYDSGINPLAYEGRKVGVFIGTSFSDTSNLSMFNCYKSTGNALSGCAKTMYANRVSFWIDGRGPSYALDCSSASSMICLEHAFKAMTAGECEAAIVGGTNLCLEPNLGLNMRKLGLVCLDGKTRCFDKNSDGYVRSDAISCIFLQKAKDAKRIYAELCFAETEYGLKEGSPFLPQRESIQIEKFLKKFYSKIDVTPEEVEYVEAEASAIPTADANELEAIAKVFAKDKPIKVGSVKSNMGSSEPASGLCAVTKVLLAYHQGKLPGNLHYSDPLDIPAIREGKVKVLQENTAFNRGYTAVNNFDFNGTNCHALLKGHFKSKDISKYKCNIPRLVPISARQEDGIKKISNILKNQPVDPEIIGMLHNIYKIDTSGHTCRGYTIIDTNEKDETVCLAESFEYYMGAKRPLWLVFSGMGSQWPGMASDLMKIPIFADVIHRCHKALEPLGVDLIKVITGPDKTTFDKILNCFIGISAVQIGLTDVLKAVGIVPDYVIGHSQGEMGCAYFDDCFTAESMILGAYSRGLVSTETKIIKGAMAAVGLGYKDILPLLPPEIDVACHNSQDSATLSGPYEALQTFIAELTAKGIFAREVPSTNIPFHSRYIAHAGPAFLSRMAKIIEEPTPRSEKWISTSIPPERWHEPLAKFSSPEYHANNMLSPVFFEEAARLIPENAVVVEVAPHGLLQAILKRSHPECVHIPLTKRGHPNQVQFLLDALGKIYQQGYKLNMEVLYPPIEYPVSTETPMISHYIEWEHSEEWPIHVNNTADAIKGTYREHVLSIHDDEYQYLAGYIRDGKNVFPEAALLQLVWETFSMHLGVNYRKISVIFQYVQFYGEAVLKSEEPLKLSVMIGKGNNNFEVCHNGILITSGYIYSVNKPVFEKIADEESEEDTVTLNSDDVYKCLHRKGLSLKGQMKSIENANLDCTTAVVQWKNNWIIFLDALLQLHVLARDSDNVAIPKMINKITICTEDHNKFTESDSIFDARLYKTGKVLRCGGVEIRNVSFDDKSNTEEQPDVLNTLTFVPHVIVGEVNIDTALLVNLQLVADNTVGEEIKVTEIISESKSSLASVIEKLADNVAATNFDIQSIDIKACLDETVDIGNLVVIQDLRKNGLDTDRILNGVNENAFVLAYDDDASEFQNGHFTVLSSMTVQGKDMKLLRKIAAHKVEATYISIDNNDNFTWVTEVQSELLKTKRVVLVSERQPNCGVFGLIKSLKKEYKDKISLVIIDDYHASTFDKCRPVYHEQIAKNLIFNVFRKGQWGSYYYLPISEPKIVQNFKLVNSGTGDNDNLRWIESAAPSSSHTPSVVQVCYAGISQKDTKKSVGIIENEENGFGMDFSGFDVKGDRVMGLVQNGALASTVRADPDLLWPVPKHWTLEEAATVPLPFIHACYCLAMRRKIAHGQSVFVNGGAGALGQAVISLCLSLNCQVYASVSDIQKKNFLLKLFPQLQEKNIGCSRNGDFHDMVGINTRGKGCDFVINCSSGASREAAMECVGTCGVFLDVNDYDFVRNNSFSMSFAVQERSYFAVNMSTIFKPQNTWMKKRLQGIIAQGIINGSVRPLSRVVYQTTEISRAFRLLSANKHKGRVLIKVRNAEISAKAMNVIHKMTCSANGSYIVICDNSELGPDLASRLVTRGAKKLMLHLKTKNVSGYLHTKFASWMKQGVQIKLSTDNLSSDQKVIQLLREAEKMGRVQGIFIVRENSSKNTWNKKDFITESDKIISLVTNLDILSRNNCRELSAFAIISRSSQSVLDEYVTSAMDEICRERLAVCLPTLSFRIECLDEFDSIVSTEERLQPQNIDTVLNALESSLKEKQTSCVTTHNLKKRRSSEFLEKVCKTLGIKNIEDVVHLTVGEFLVNDINLEELRALIKKYFDVETNAKKLRNMSIASIKTLSRSKQNVANGLGTLCTFVQSDEYMATNEMIKMRTLCTNMIDTRQLDGTAPHLILLPGFDGQGEIFSTVCERLKLHAMTFQLGPDVIDKSIPEMATSIMENIKKTFDIKSKFYLLGYSFGVNVALEVASLLEKEGYNGIVYCLDSSPDAVKVTLEAQIGDVTDSELENLVLTHITKLITRDVKIDVKELDGLINWTEKVDSVIRKLRKSVSFTYEYLKNVFESAHHKILIARSYTPEIKLDSEIVLIKGKNSSEFEILEADYGLSKFTNKPVKIFNVKLDHYNVPKDCRVSNIVNKFLEPEILEQFQNTNFCKTYVVG